MPPLPLNLPLDDAIPALQLLRDRGFDFLLEPVAQKRPFSLHSVLRHHPGKRCTLSVASGDGLLIFKAYRDAGHLRRAVAVMEALDASAPGRRWATPHLLATDPDNAFLVTDAFPGPSAKQLIASGRGGRAGRAAAAWITAPGLEPPAGQRPPESPLERAAAMADLIRKESALLSGPSSALLRSLAAAVPPQRREVLVHGSFKPGHIFDVGGAAGLIDWESARTGAIELDAGCFLAKLSSIKLRHPSQSKAVDEARRTFIEETRGTVDPHALFWYEAFAQLKRAVSASLRPG
ncbi:MAG: phosphotransferase family protein, partial [Actinomycetota bacterium]